MLESSTMKRIRVRDIRPEGLEIQDTIEPDLLGLQKDDILFFSKPIKVEAELEKVNSTVLAKTNVQGKFSTACARCLEAVERPWDEEYYLDFPVDKTTEYIDLEDNIRQEILMNLPTRILCKDDCQGLCLKCGANLNKEKCKCKKK